MRKIKVLEDCSYRLVSATSNYVFDFYDEYALKDEIISFKGDLIDNGNTLSFNDNGVLKVFSSSSIVVIPDIEVYPTDTPEDVANKYREYYKGKVIIFESNEKTKKELERGEHDFFSNQLARVVDIYSNGLNGIKVGDFNNYVIVTEVDFSEFEEYNKTIAPPVYFDKNGSPRLKWHETNYYPKDCRNKIYTSTELPYSLHEDR